MANSDCGLCPMPPVAREDSTALSVDVNKTQFAICSVFGPGYWLERVRVLYREDDRCYGQVSTDEYRERYAAQ
jgi:hypothetical protein